MPGNTSATGGYLSPTVQSPPLEGEDLLNFVHDIIAGITSMDPTVVRPAWQPEPPNIPKQFNAWCAFRITDRPSDTFPYVEHIGDGDGSDVLQRHEELHTLVSFYDTGSTGDADRLAALFRDGTAIAQNREAMRAGGFAFVSCGQLTAVPSLLKQRWLYRVDVPFVLRREIDRTYPVLNLLSAHGDIKDEEITVPFNVQE